MAQFCKTHKNQKKILFAAIKIQSVLWMKIKKLKESRELRAKLKSLPYVVRASFVKMHFLKANTRALTSNLGMKLGVNPSTHPLFNTNNTL